MGLIHHLNPLEYKIIGFLEFEIETPLHISAGTTEARRVFLRVPGDRGFLISSSTWKGAFRSISERIARSMRFESDLTNLAVKSFREDSRITYEVSKEFCEDMLNVLRGHKSNIIPYNKEDLAEIACKIGFTSDEVNEIRDKGFSARDNLLKRLAESILAVHCPIGKLYGNHVLAGKVRFLDIILGHRAGLIHERAGISINRRSGTVREGALFTFESIVNERVKLRIVVDNLTPGAEDSKLFALTLEAIKNLGLSLGARKSAGMGSLKMRNEESYWYIVDLRNDEGGVGIGNPFKYTEKISVDEFLKWLQGQNMP